MNKRMLTVALGSAVAMAAVPALAQETRPLGLSIRAGLFFPSDGDARDEGSSWFTAGLEYKIKDLNMAMSDTMMRSHLSISADWFSKGDFSHIPVLLNWVGSQNEVYYTIGAGLGFVETPGDDNSTKFAYSVGIGYNFQQSQTPLFVEARYIGSSESSLNGFTVGFGIRF